MIIFGFTLIQKKLILLFDLEEIDSTILIEQLKVVSKLRVTNPYRKKGQLVSILPNDWNKINLQLENLYRLRPLKNI